MDRKCERLSKELNGILICFKKQKNSKQVDQILLLPCVSRIYVKHGTLNKTYQYKNAWLERWNLQHTILSLKRFHTERNEIGLSNTVN